MDSSKPTYESLSSKLRDLGIGLSPSDNRLINVADFYKDFLDGSHIAVPSHESRWGSWHHGVFMGSKQVMHMYGNNKKDAHVQLCSVNEFTAGTNVIALVIYEDDSHTSVQAALFLQNTMKVHDL